MKTETIQRGESLIVKLTLQQANGAALQVADVLAVTCELIQGNAVKLSLTLGSDPRLRSQGATLILELTKQTTAALAKGGLTERYTFTLTAADHTAEGGQRTRKIDVQRVNLT